MGLGGAVPVGTTKRCSTHHIFSLHRHTQVQGNSRAEAILLA